MPFRNLVKGLHRKAKVPNVPPQSQPQDTISSASASQSPATYASSTSSTVPFPEGVKVLHDSPDDFVDICFIHGLTGNRESTWAAAAQEKSWLETLLPTSLNGARILTYGYDAYVVRGLGAVASQNRLIDHATDFLNDLSNDRAMIQASARPIIFVAHSLGGLVCKEALLLSRNNPEAHLVSIFSATRAIMFLGTPHTGSWMADWTKLPAAGLGVVKSTNKSLLSILRTKNELLEAIQRGFLEMVRGLQLDGRQIHITCFYEALPLPLVGKVVSKESATLLGYNLISIHADHRDMVKFATGDENGYKRVVGELARWTAEIRADLDLADSVLEKTSTLDIISTMIQLLELPDNQRSRIAMTEIIDLLDLGRRLCKLRTLAPRIQGYIVEKDVQELEIRKVYKDAVRRCLRSLSFREMGQRRSNIQEPADGTCLWIYQRPEYREWHSTSNKILWLKGKPGSGKSVLMRSIDVQRHDHVADAEFQGVASQSLLLSFFFNARGAQMENSPLGLYMTLMHQLLSQDAISMCEFLLLFLQNEAANEPGAIVWRREELSRLFHKLISAKQPYTVEVLIDALDECNDEEIREIVRAFEASIDSAILSGAYLRICWSSRHYPHISLQSPHGSYLHVDKNNDEDIRIYLDAALSGERDSSYRHLKGVIESRANGVFLWTIIVVKRLIKSFDQGKSDKEVLKLLDTIPLELSSLFGQIFDSVAVTEGQTEDLVRIIQWNLCAYRPLSLDDLIVLFSVQENKSRWSLRNIDFSRQYVERIKRQVIDLSGGLLEITDDTNHDYDGVMQFIHESVRDFFRSTTGHRILGFNSEAALLEAAHKDMAIQCLRVLLASEFEIEDQTEFDNTIHVSSALATISSPFRRMVRNFFSFPNRFFKSYAQLFTFDHFSHAKVHFSDVAAAVPQSVETSAVFRRKGLLNLLRYHCHESKQMLQSEALARHRLQFNYRLELRSFRKVLTDPDAWGSSISELLTLVAFRNNLCAVSSYLSGTHRFRFDDPANEHLSLSFSREFLIACFVKEDTASKVLNFQSGGNKTYGLREALSPAFTQSEGSNDGSELLNSLSNDHLGVRFAFAMVFHVQYYEPEQNPRISTGEGFNDRRYFSPLITDCFLTEQIDQTMWPEKHQSVLSACSKYRIQDLKHPQLCYALFHRLPPEPRMPDLYSYSRLSIESDETSFVTPDEYGSSSTLNLILFDSNASLHRHDMWLLSSTDDGVLPEDDDSPHDAFRLENAAESARGLEGIEYSQPIMRYDIDNCVIEEIPGESSSYSDDSQFLFDYQQDRSCDQQGLWIP